MKRGKKMIKYILISIVFIIIVILILFVYRINTIKIGKALTIEVIEEEKVNAEKLEYIIENKDAYKYEPIGKFELLEKQEIKKLIKYMKKNNLKIVPGIYELHQTNKYKEMIKILDFCDDN